MGRLRANRRSTLGTSTRHSSYYLSGKWRNGALEGKTEEDAFFVEVGRETMTEADIQNGRLIVKIGIAPVRPAEFVIFRIFQKTRLQD